MPLYDFRCEAGHLFERQVPLKDFELTQICGCNVRAKRLISKPQIMVDQTGYSCPVTGKWVGSRREHENNLAVHGCRVLEGGETSQTVRNREAEEAALDKKLEDTVEREIESWSGEKREQLHNELVNGGLDIQVERK